MAGKIKPERAAKPKPAKMRSAATTSGACLCGGVEIEIDTPVFWAWHDHSASTRLAHGAAYATFVGCWESKVRIVRGTELVSDFADTALGHVRSFCSRCGSPVMFARSKSPKMVNLPRALLDEIDTFVKRFSRQWRETELSMLLTRLRVSLSDNPQKTEV